MKKIVSWVRQHGVETTIFVAVAVLGVVFWFLDASHQRAVSAFEAHIAFLQTQVDNAQDQASDLLAARERAARLDAELAVVRATLGATQSRLEALEARDWEGQYLAERIARATMEERFTIAAAAFSEERDSLHRRIGSLQDALSHAVAMDAERLGNPVQEIDRALAEIVATRLRLADVESELEQCRSTSAARERSLTEQNAILERESQALRAQVASRDPNSGGTLSPDPPGSDGGFGAGRGGFGRRP